MRRYLTLIILATAAAGCTTKPVVKVESTCKTDMPKKKALRRIIEQPASIEPFQDASLLAQISGEVTNVYVDIEKTVEGPKNNQPGTLLAEIAVPQMLKEHAQKVALVNQARAEIEQAKAHLAEAEAKITRADANHERWESEYARVADLFKSRVVEKQIVDETLSQYKVAKAARVEAVAHRDKEKADVAVAEARVVVAEAEEGRLKALSDYRFIRAPFDGIVTRRFIHTGHFLQPNASGGPTVVFMIAQTDKLRVVADIPETEAQYIASELAAKVHVPALGNQAFPGQVARTSFTLDGKSRTLRVEIDLDNKAKKLRPGMFANVVFDIDLGSRLTLPASAIFTHADAPCCWRVVDGKAVRTPLKLGVRDGQDVEVLNLTGNEEIVITNLAAVSEGKDVPIQRK